MGRVAWAVLVAAAICFTVPAHADDKRKPSSESRQATKEKTQDKATKKTPRKPLRLQKPSRTVGGVKG